MNLKNVFMAYTESNKTEKEIVHEIKDVREISDSSPIIKDETTQPDLSTE